MSGDGGCSVRCLAPETVAAAEADLEGREATTVAFVCSQSQEEVRVTLVSPERADALARVLEPLGSGSVVRILLALRDAELCQCDVATLVGRDEDDIARTLADLAGRGLLRHRDISGMNYYGLADPSLGRLLEGLLAGTGARGISASACGRGPGPEPERDAEPPGSGSDR